MLRALIHTLLLLTVLLSADSASAQRVVSSDFSRYPSVTTYGVEFIIKGIDTAGLDVLCKISIEKYAPLRKKNERVEIKDTETGLIIVLFSEKELQVIRQPYYTFKQINGRKNE